MRSRAAEFSGGLEQKLRVGGSSVPGFPGRMYPIGSERGYRLRGLVNGIGRA
jgi:hypothetical protein